MPMMIPQKGEYPFSSAFVLLLFSAAVAGCTAPTPKTGRCTTQGANLAGVPTPAEAHMAIAIETRLSLTDQRCLDGAASSTSDAGFDVREIDSSQLKMLLDSLAKDPHTINATTPRATLNDGQRGVLRLLVPRSYVCATVDLRALPLIDIQVERAAGSKVRLSIERIFQDPGDLNAYGASPDGRGMLTMPQKSRPFQRTVEDGTTLVLQGFHIAYPENKAHGPSQWMLLIRVNAFVPRDEEYRVFGQNFDQTATQSAATQKH